MKNMKKFSKILFIFMCVMFLPLMVNAKEKCTVVSGNKTDIGSEIVCGTEHFNIISSNDNEIRMLSKYNLNVGTIITKEKINKDEGSTETDSEYCIRLASEKGGYLRRDQFYNAEGYCFIEAPLNYSTMQWESDFSSDGLTSISRCEEHAEELNASDENYYYSFIYDETHSENSYRVPYCYYKKIPKGLVQNENAISAHWNENDEFLYPQVGDVYIDGIYEDFLDNTYFKSDFVCDNNSSNKYDGYFWDLNVNKNSQFDIILKSYEATLSPYNIKGIDLITLDDINKVIINNNKELSYKTIYEASPNAQPPRYEFAFLQDYLTKQQEFLFNTTYWVRTGYNKDYDDDLAVGNVVFVDSRGGICGSAITRNVNHTIYGNCSYKIERSLKSSVGTGIRPVITISSEDIVEPKREVIVNPKTGSIAVLVLVGLCGLLFVGRQSLKRIS